jgi:hypothetical protein
MKIPTDEIEFRKKIGKCKGKDITHIKLRGGLHLITQGPSQEIIGTGSHGIVARHIAKARLGDDLEWTELSKADWLPEAAYSHLIPEYQELTTRFRKLQGF